MPKQPMTVQEMRRHGYKVQVRYERFQCIIHVRGQKPILSFRPYSPRNGFMFVLNDGTVSPSFEHSAWPRGGTCKVVVTTPEGKTLTGESRCSLKDNFDRRVGLGLALERLS